MNIYKTPPFPTKKYQLIYADPPWRYDFSRSENREIENQYSTMALDDICTLAIPADDNAILFLWATAPKLCEALKVMAAWGFKYKTHAIWDKEIIGMGYWFRGQHELLLVGVRGDMHPPDPSERMSSIWKEKRTKHSKKPEGIRKAIAYWYPSLSKIELFARQKKDGWDMWGLEVPETTQKELMLEPPRPGGKP